MANLNFPYSSAKVRTVQEIRFGVFSPQESERLAVMDIVYPETLYVDFCTNIIKKLSSDTALGMSNVNEPAHKDPTIPI